MSDLNSTGPPPPKTALEISVRVIPDGGVAIAAALRELRDLTTNALGVSGRAMIEARSERP